MSDLPQHWVKWLLPCLDWLETSKLDCPWPPIFGAYGKAEMTPDWEHPLQHINNLVPYTLRMLTRWPGALDRSLASFLLMFPLLFVLPFLFLSFLFFLFCPSAPLVCKRTTRGAKRVCLKLWEKYKAERVTFFCYLPSSLDFIAILIPQPSRYRPTCKHGRGWSPRCKMMQKSWLLTSQAH